MPGISCGGGAVGGSQPRHQCLSQAQILGGQFTFNYSANPGLSYFVQASSNLVNWSSLITNVAVTSSVPYSAAFAHTGSVFYRVGRLPNP